MTIELSNKKQEKILTDHNTQKTGDNTECDNSRLVKNDICNQSMCKYQDQATYDKESSEELKTQQEQKCLQTQNTTYNIIDSYINKIKNYCSNFYNNLQLECVRIIRVFQDHNCQNKLFKIGLITALTGIFSELLHITIGILNNYLYFGDQVSKINLFISQFLIITQLISYLLSFICLTILFTYRIASIVYYKLHRL